jgi:hypothetical protein
MYWIYLIIFTAIVFVPTWVQNGFWGLSEIQSQEYVILMLGLLAYMLFVIQERKLSKVSHDRRRMQSEVNRMNRDLNSSYSYIGEINRKLDILKRLVMQIPVSENFDSKDDQTYLAIIEAIQILTKSNNVAIRFVDKQKNLLKQVATNKKVFEDIALSEHCNMNKKACETDKVLMICTDFNHDGYSACILVKKQEGVARRIEDIEIFKAMASHALFLFMLSKGKELD